MPQSSEVAVAEARPTGRAFGRATKLVAAFNLLGLVAASILLFSYFTWRLPRTFLTFTNIETIGIQAASLSMATLGMTLIIIAGAIDLSVGSIVALVTTVIALTLQNHGPWMALLFGVGAGALAGFFNGYVV